MRLLGLERHLEQIHERAQDRRIESLERQVRHLRSQVHYHLPPLAPPTYGQCPYWVPPPHPHYAGAPTGRGLTKAPSCEGWPENSFRTAGGYTVVFDGTRQSMKVYGPNQKPGDKPLTNVWGDPHVHEGDGTKWDFTKDGDMILPDGTMIAMDTTSQTGQSFLDNVTIVNGNDRVKVSGIRHDRPSAGFITGDGYHWRANHVASKAGTDYSTFVMGSRPGENVTFNLFVGGVDQGEITGAKYDGTKYVQKTDGGRLYRPNPFLRPPIGSPAWCNLLNNLAVDYLAAHPFGPCLDFIRQAHQFPFGFGPGGLGGCFPGFGPAHGALGQLGQLIGLSHGANGVLAQSGNHSIQNSNPLREARYAADIERIFADPSLSVEDQVMLVLMRIMNKMDEDITRQTKHLARLQNQQNGRKKKKKGGIGGMVGGVAKMAGGVAGTAFGGPVGGMAGNMAGGMLGGILGGGGGAGGGVAGDKPTVDTEAMKLSQMVKKRGNLFEALKGILDKYNETAKNTAQGIGR